MNWKVLTPEEVMILKANPFVKSVTAKMIRFTVEFKENFWEEYQNGRTPTAIITDMGLDPDVLGASRINGILQHIKEAANSGGGFRDCRQANILNDSADALSPSKALIHMQHEVAYLKQELEFIKKIILADRGASRRCSSGKSRT